MKVQIEPAIHDPDFRCVAQLPFLFRTQKEIVDLVRECLTRIVFEQGLKRALTVLFVCANETIPFADGLNEGGLAHSACADD